MPHGKENRSYKRGDIKSFYGFDSLILSSQPGETVALGEKVQLTKLMLLSLSG